MKLTAKQKKFCDEYLTDLNAAAAAIRAGYSPKTAKVIGCENLTKPYLQTYIGEKQKQRADKLQLSQEIVLEGYRKLAFYDARKFYDEDGNLKQITDLDDETSFALNGFEVMEEKGGDGKGHQVVLGYTKKIRMSERKGALDSICKVLGFNSPDKVDHTTKGDKIINNIDYSKLSTQTLLELRQAVKIQGDEG